MPQSSTPLLDTITTPTDLRRLSPKDLPRLADEVRADMIEAVSKTGGHLGPGLGVVELTLAVHYVFDTPEDRLIWDVGHQAYPHKILTGRRDRLSTIRQGGGLSGFTRRSESEYDPFGAGHSSTSISAGLGMAVARDKKEADRHVLCIIGDGAMSAGMAFEAMNNAGFLKSRLIVILNDNDMSIAPNVGAMSNYLSRLLSSKSYHSVRHAAKEIVKYLPEVVKSSVRRAEEYARGMMAGGTLFEELGMYYVGPVDGHNFDHLLPVLRNVQTTSQDRPILIHVVTEKGRGHPFVGPSKEKYHAVPRFDVVTGTQAKSTSGPPSYTQVFANNLVRCAEKDRDIVAITAAMASGTGLSLFAERFPDRFFDVGIAEQHAVTFAAGMAADGLKPFVAVYSSFLQRAYDQVLHDVVLQNLPVRFAIDRAGPVGADGPTHAGSFDLAYLGNLPGLVLMAPADEAELARMVVTAAGIDDRPCAFRYPRGAGVGAEMTAVPEPVEIGRGRRLREGSTVALLSIGTRLADCLQAADILEARGLSTTVADARFARPLDLDLVHSLANHHVVLVTVEEGVVGGFGTQVLHSLAEAGRLDTGLKIRVLTLPDRFLEQNSQTKQIADAGLDPDSIVVTVLEALGEAQSHATA